MNKRVIREHHKELFAEAYVEYHKEHGKYTGIDPRPVNRLLCALLLTRRDILADDRHSRVLNALRDLVDNIVDLNARAEGSRLNNTDIVYKRIYEKHRKVEASHLDRHGCTERHDHTDVLFLHTEAFALEIEAEGYEAAGSYVVAGDSYHIILPQAEVYSDGKVRYEIDHERREVNVDVVDLTSRNVLDNPTRCFDFVGEGYELSLVEQSANEVVVRIVATDGAFEGEIFLMADAKGKPMELKYQLYDDVIRVKIKSLAPRKAKLPTFAKSVYKDYDIIDFR